MHIITKTITATRELRRHVGIRALQRAGAEFRELKKPKDMEVEKDTVNAQYPRKFFSAIKPTGALHLGNYFGAVQKWTQLQNEREDLTFSIVDMHAMTSSQNPVVLRENIFEMAATLLACGVDPEKSALFVQSSVKEHSELCWILACLTSSSSVSNLAQFKEITRQSKDIPLGLYIYPVLQAADILLYKSTHSPVGNDQLQHIQLSQHLAKAFNSKYGVTFPLCQSIINDKKASRIRSLREAHKKMSKSDLDPNSTIYLTDEPDVIVEKIKKASTDFISDVTYAPDIRPAVSNLLAIHSLCTGKTVEAIVDESRTIDTGNYKAQVAEVVVELLNPMRNKIKSQLNRRNELIYLLDAGAEKARQVAQETLHEARQKAGLGAMHVPLTMMMQQEVKPPPVLDVKPEKPKVQPMQLNNKIGLAVQDCPSVPKQLMRVEKKPRPPFRIDFKIAPPAIMQKAKQSENDVKKEEATAENQVNKLEI